MRALLIFRLCWRRARLAAPAFSTVTASVLLMQASIASAAETVSVLYAGSLVNLMEHSVGPTFDKAWGDRFQGYAGGSNLLANQIKGKLRQGDVFISANPKVNASLMGSANGDWVSWYIAFAQSPLVIGYNPSSRFAADFKTTPWYQALSEPGIRLGRTDPKLDPKGQLTLELMHQAETFYKDPDLAQRVLGAPENPDEVLPEETLVGRLQSGQLDAGFFYSTENVRCENPGHQFACRDYSQSRLYSDHFAWCTRSSRCGSVCNFPARRRWPNPHEGLRARCAKVHADRDCELAASKHPIASR